MDLALKNLEQKFYNLDSIWQNTNLFPYQKNIIADILSILPVDIQNIIDLGCGDGYITNAMPEYYDVFAADWSLTAIKAVQKNKLVGSIDCLAFADDSFDLVMANDVIEHIPDDTYPIVLSEIERISKKYILLTVPFEENLKNYETYCLHCGEEYHVNLHKRSYHLNEIYNLFSKDKWKITKIVFSGEDQEPTYQFNENFRHEMGLKRHWDKAMCPHCGSQESVDFGYQHLIYTRDDNPFIRHMTSHFAKRNECIVLFERIENKPKKINNNGFKLINAADGQKYESTINIDNGQPYINFQHQIEHQDLTLSYFHKNIEYLLPRVKKIESKGFEIPEWFYKTIVFSYKNEKVQKVLSEGKENVLKDTYLLNKKLDVIEKNVEEIIFTIIRSNAKIKKIVKLAIISSIIFLVIMTIVFLCVQK